MLYAYYIYTHTHSLTNFDLQPAKEGTINSKPIPSRVFSSTQIQRADVPIQCNTTHCIRKNYASSFQKITPKDCKPQDKQLHFHFLFPESTIEIAFCVLGMQEAEADLQSTLHIHYFLRLLNITTAYSSTN